MVINKMHSKNIVYLLCFIIIFSICINTYAAVDLLNLGDIPAKGVAIIDMNGRLLYGKNEEEHMRMASTTKIMTSLITLQQNNLDKYFCIDPNAVYVEGTSMGLLPGDQVTLRSLAWGMMIASGNDAAEVAALKIADSREKFLDIMNEKARCFGCKNTHFATPTGLDDKDHYSTPRDMAIISRYAMLNSDFADICKEKYATLEYGNPPYRRTLKNYNTLLWNYEYCSGIKTGFTDDAGKCLISCAIKNDITLIMVMLNCRDFSKSHIDAYEGAFYKMINKNIDVTLPVNRVRVVGGELSNILIKNDYKILLPIVKGEEEKISYTINLKKFLYAPVKKDTIVGQINYYIDGKKVTEQPIITLIDVAKEEKVNLRDKGLMFIKDISKKLGM